MSELNKMIDVARQFERHNQLDSIIQDNAKKTTFALGIIGRLPQTEAKPEEPPRLPSLGALAIPS